MERNEEYRIELEVFEGPLDLLLYLIKKDEVDIYDIPIELITTQYMEYMDLMRMLDLNIAGDFLVMAATLMMIKSRMLLPVEERGEVEEEDDEDPRWDLVRQLVEYKKFKDAAGSLQIMEERQENVFSHEDSGIQLGQDVDTALMDVNIFDLIAAFNSALKRVKTEELTEIFGERYTVTEKIDVVLKMLEEHEEVPFEDLFARMASRSEIVCTFLAVLELMRLSQIKVVQDTHFAKISIKRLA